MLKDRAIIKLTKNVTWTLLLADTFSSSSLSVTVARINMDKEDLSVVY